MIGHYVGPIGSVASAILLGLWWFLRSRRTVASYAGRAAIVSVAAALSGFYLLGAESWYLALAPVLPPGTVMAPTEPEFFAVQTLTTVGYGGGLSLLRDGVSEAALAQFRTGANLAMLFGSLVWGCAIAAIANLFFGPPAT